MTTHTRATPADIARIWKQLWGDLTPEQVRAITEKEDKMNGYIDTNAEYRLNARHLKHIEATYGKDWEQVADAIRPLIAAAEAEVFTDGFCDNGLTDDRPYRAGNTDGEMPL